MTYFRDRRDAGRQLAQELLPYVGRDDAIVLALPRGGVPVAYEVALALNLPLDVFIVRKLGLPGRALQDCRVQMIFFGLKSSKRKTTTFAARSAGLLSPQKSIRKKLCN